MDIQYREYSMQNIILNFHTIWLHFVQELYLDNGYTISYGSILCKMNIHFLHFVQELYLFTILRDIEKNPKILYSIIETYFLTNDNP